MPDLSPESVDRFLENLLIGEDQEMENVLKRSDEAGLRPIAVSPMLGATLSILAAAIGARRILEIGALGGYSTIWLARALPEGGRVTTLEIDPKSVATVRANAAAAGVGDKVCVIEGAAAQTLDRMIAEKERPFDFVFIDADKESYPLYLDRALKLARKGALIVADNVVREGEVANLKSKDSYVLGARAYLEAARNHPRLKTSVLQTVGAKGHDGIAISFVS